MKQRKMNYDKKLDNGQIAFSYTANEKSCLNTKFQQNIEYYLGLFHKEIEMLNHLCLKDGYSLLGWLDVYKQLFNNVKLFEVELIVLKELTQSSNGDITHFIDIRNYYLCNWYKKWLFGYLRRIVPRQLLAISIEKYYQIVRQSHAQQKTSLK